MQPHLRLLDILTAPVDRLPESCDVANTDPSFVHLASAGRRLGSRVRGPRTVSRWRLSVRHSSNNECYYDGMLNIRRASEADVDALSPLKAAVHDQHVKERPDFFKPMKSEELIAWLRKRLTEEATHVWMAEDRGIVAGYVLATRRQREETQYSFGRQWCEIDEIVVGTTYRQRGVARALMTRAIAHAHELGLNAIELSTWAFNEHAHTAFARLGFQQMLVRYQLGAGF